MENTVVGVYDSYAQAQNAMNELLSAGFSRSDVQLSPDTERATGSNSSDAGGGSGIGNFFRSLFGMDDERDTRDVYSEAVRRGSCVLTVNAASDDLLDRATEIMNRYDPVDIDERSSHWRTQGWSGYDDSAPMLSDSEIEKDRTAYGMGRTGTTTSGVGSAAMASGTAGVAGATGTGTGMTNEQRIPIVEEELRVGKREVQRGGVRIYSRIRETPVNESVTLREEHVHVERHPVNQPASEADIAAFKEGSVELRETAEEPVVSKTARVVEEVVVGKEVTQETANINDTVRRTDVEVEQLGASGATRNTDFADTMATSDDSDYRTHWQQAYGSSGGRYEDYDAAYRHGSTMAGSSRFSNYRWEDAEPEMRRSWESSHPESTWDKVKDAVRYGAEKVSGRARH
ncbi:YsnF/AvaK domain-containing protein [Noviherbaspirillum aridicola]|uniref:DUF2382 domain-containing protein n=1 Tax=Noviherbaspirillum aridicola TaxID=2849687 RepID=A0ABQ4Q4P4_9BURK|nr:YsnF/AvaK domain-containing protein [Noviherbaspirillum aridicola]GIZ51709.1 hypothetical protein NCCP691_17230 [Noviherbaspirillum aridicola]